MAESDLDTMERDLTFYPARNDAPGTLTREQIDRYNELGFVLPFRIFDEAQAAANRRYFDGLLAQVFDADDGRDGFSINGYQDRCRGIYDLIVNPLILDHVEDLLGPDFVCWGAHYFCKLPGEAREVSWHQDAAYWPLTPSKTVTVWLAVDDADRDNGCMKVIPGTHRLGEVPTRETAPGVNVLSREVLGAERYGREPVYFELKAGEVSLHSDLLIHGSDPNRSDRRRCGLTMRYAPVDVRGLWNETSIICRGEDPSGHWADIPRPAGDDPKPKENQVRAG